MAHPWFDSTALWTLTRWYLPLSRAWAAGAAANGSLDRFCAELPAERIGAAGRLGLKRALDRTAAFKARYDAAEAEWRRVFFSSAPVEQRSLAAAERRRRQASARFMMARSGFALVRLGTAYPAVRYDIPSPQAGLAEVSPLLRDPAAAYAPVVPAPAIEESLRLRHARSSEYWLRFPSAHPDRDDIAWAHVREPEGVDDPPSLIHVHGLGVEFESLDGIEDDVDPIVEHGVRLIRLEALWHNRRRRPGFYGGEPFLSRQPVSGLELFQATARELAALIAWCRSTSRGRVAIGGTSMGALATQLAAGRARDWPAPSRPDALWLVTTSDDIGGLVFNSALAKAVRLPEALAAAGWTREAMAPLDVLGDTSAPPAMAPEDIVVVLGRTDVVTPYAEGASLARRWGVPESNIFRRAHGHFSVPVGLLGDRGPLLRLVERLHARPGAPA